MTHEPIVGESDRDECNVRGHIPVLLEEVVTYLGELKGQKVIDGTFGGGGYTTAILKAGADVLAIDQDPEAIVRGKGLKEEYGARLTLVRGRFGELRQIASSNGFEGNAAVVLDIGVSSFQLDDAERGFSYRQNGPLDMRMSTEGLSAADVLNRTHEKELADIIYKYGEERRSRQIAKAVVTQRRKKKFATTNDLLEVIEQIYPHKGQVRRHPAGRTFQALRIFVNKELEELENVIPQACDTLKEGGRLGIVTFHSLEDRIVKNIFRDMAKEDNYALVMKKPIAPTDEEVEKNPRARSAKLRVIEKKAS